MLETDVRLRRDSGQRIARDVSLDHDGAGRPAPTLGLEGFARQVNLGTFPEEAVDRGRDRDGG